MNDLQVIQSKIYVIRGQRVMLTLTWPQPMGLKHRN